MRSQRAPRAQRSELGLAVRAVRTDDEERTAAAGFKLKPFCVKPVSLHGFLNNHIQSGIGGI